MSPADAIAEKRREAKSWLIVAIACLGFAVLAVFIVVSNSLLSLCSFPSQFEFSAIWRLEGKRCGGFYLISQAYWISVLTFPPLALLSLKCLLEAKVLARKEKDEGAK